MQHRRVIPEQSAASCGVIKLNSTQKTSVQAHLILLSLSYSIKINTNVVRRWRVQRVSSPLEKPLEPFRWWIVNLKPSGVESDLYWSCVEGPMGHLYGKRYRVLLSGATGEVNHGSGSDLSPRCRACALQKVCVFWIENEPKKVTTSSCVTPGSWCPSRRGGCAHVCYRSGRRRELVAPRRDTLGGKRRCAEQLVFEETGKQFRQVLYHVFNNPDHFRLLCPMGFWNSIFVCGRPRHKLIAHLKVTEQNQMRSGAVRGTTLNRSLGCEETHRHCSYISHLVWHDVFILSILTLFSLILCALSVDCICNLMFF